MLRFHLDENVPTAVARGLRARGIDLTTADEAGLLSAEDEVHLAIATTAGRVVVTHDEDFCDCTLEDFRTLESATVTEKNTRSDSWCEFCF